MGKGSTLTNFPPEPGCEDYSFVDQAMGDFGHGQDSILTDSINTSKLDASLNVFDVVPSSVSSNFLYSARTISDTSRLQLAPRIKSHKLRCQARALFLSIQQADECQL